MQKIHYQTIYDVEQGHWWYKTRRGIVHDLINKFVKNKPISILDVGCGPGALMTELKQYGQVEGVDFSPDAVSFCKSRGIESVQVAPAESLPFPSENFDLVLALDVLEHLKDDDKAMKEIYRVLKPNGQIIIFVPAFNFLWSITDVLSQHYRRYRLKNLVQLVEGNNFVIKKRSYFNFFLFSPIASVRLLVKTLGIQMQDENKIGNKLVNKLMYLIFSTERPILKYFNFPFGVSAMVVAAKK